MANIGSYIVATTALLAVIETTTEAAPVTMTRSEYIRYDRETTATDDASAHQIKFAAISAPKSIMESNMHRRYARSDPVSNYYDFIINEGSYKFWAVFQVGTAALLIYSAFAAVYYAKYTFATTDYSDYEDDFFFRRSGAAYTHDTPSPVSASSSILGISPEMFQFIMNAISSKKYS